MNVEAHNNLGGLYLGRNLLEEAAREFQRVLAIDPAYTPAYINLSATLYKLGRFDAAAAQAREAVRLDPRNGDGYVNLALAQKASAQHSESQGSLRRALEINPRHPLAHYNLARQYEDAGDFLRAVEHYKQFLQYAGPEQETHAVDVRARMVTLQARATR
jgi:tetratricopeptide (TPR) repeat protein